MQTLLNTETTPSDAASQVAAFYKPIQNISHFDSLRKSLEYHSRSLPNFPGGESERLAEPFVSNKRLPFPLLDQVG